MRLYSDETRRDRAALAKARQHLAEITDGIEDVTEEYLDANDAVIAAEKPLAWWQRLDIELDLHTLGRDARDADTDTF